MMTFKLIFLSFFTCAMPVFAQTPQFYAGADISALPLREMQGAKFSDQRGEADLLTIARRNGWNLMRVRLWVAPENQPEKIVSDLAHVTALGKRIKTAKLGFLLDIHYSDTWADPGAQKKPAAWENLDFPALVEKTRAYSRQVLIHLRENGALPDMVQIGNETRNGWLYGSAINGASEQLGGGFWEKNAGGRDRAVQLFKAGLDGVREGAAPEKAPLCILHLPDGQDSQFVADYGRELFASAQNQKIDLNFEVFGLSYYPAHPWNKEFGFDGWKLANLAHSLKVLATTYHQPILVVETAWPRAGTPDETLGKAPFAFSPAGQADFYRALVETIKATPAGLGLGVVPWDQDSRNWDSVFDENGRALPAVGVLGEAVH